MTIIDELTHRNETFAASNFSPELKILPSSRLLILGCVDPRVDPSSLFALAPGQAAIVRNIGGRVDETFFRTLDVLSAVSQAAGKPLGTGWNLLVLHHTDCGIVSCYRHAPDVLAKYLGVPRANLETLAIADPDKAVATDVAALRSSARLATGFTVSGMVYDVKTGRVHVVVPATSE